MTQYTLMNMKYRKIFALLLTAVLTGTGSSTVMAQGPTVHGSVYGGGNLATVGGSVVVKIEAGTIDNDVYGGGALANTNVNNWDATANSNAGGWSDATQKSAKYTTTVRLTGGTVGNVYGGGLGQKTGVNGATSDIAAIVYGDVLVDLNGTTTMSGGKATTNGTMTTSTTGCVVDRIFGCNNVNGTPKGDVMVHVFATQNAGKDGISGTVAKETEESDKDYLQRLINIAKSGDTVAEGVDATVIANAQTAHDSGTDEDVAAAITAVTAQLGQMYDVYAVYGGGNNAAYIPVTPYIDDTTTPTGSKAQVVIEGCDYTSIQYVYGGGNAAPVPDTYVLVKGTKIIDYVFGGGNGTVSAADVGYDANGNNQGNGNANTTLVAGTIHNVYGASNTNGDIRGKANITKTDKVNTDTGCCDKLVVNKMYAAGKDADISGGSKTILGCMPEDEIEEYYGGAENANVLGDVELTITSGKFGKVFGGNKTSGAIFGHIIVNIEETGCRPIEIDELYGCGNDAPYSIYGYYQSGTNAVNKPIYTARTSAGDTNGAAVKPDGSAYTNEGDDKFTPYADPVLNIISAKHIGKVFGGGLGSNAKVYGSPTVNINMIKGTATGSPTTLGTIGDVYGGGNAANVIGNTTVNIGTETKVRLHELIKSDGTYQMSAEQDVLGANITGDVFGGGQLADVGKYDVANDNVDVAGNTYVNIGAKEGDDPTTTDVEEYTCVAHTATGYVGITIAGNVFGGGEGQAIEPTSSAAVDGAFKCAKAIVTGGTNIHIGNGTVNGTVYGGGEVGRVEGNSVVAIGIGAGSTPATSAPEIKGDVFGAGKGKKTHGYSALLRGNPTVTIEGDAKVRGSVYGGGEIASVGRYNVKKGPNNPVGAPDDVLVGMPYSLANSGSGYCTIIIQGNAEIGPEAAMQMKKTGGGGPDDTGHVIGGGKGVLPYDGYGVTDDDWVGDPWRVSIDDKKDIFNSSNTTYTTNYEKEYFKYIETLALATETNVTIAGNAFVKGSVYGGSLNGHVQHDTHVTIAGGQIGAGEGMTEPYKATDWTGSTTPTGGWKECAHWDFDKDSGAPYDPMATTSGSYDYTNYGFVPEAARKTSSEGGLPEAKDGHTYYGNVFGGGSGVIPYAPGLWHRGAGSVGGNTYVNITGGHILTSVYGGNEHTDVGTYTKDENGQPTTTPAADNARGKCTVNMTGGTVGVPRTLEQIQAHPVTCYVFGAGKGDQRIFFNTWTNVIDTEVNISGNARIYGSTFGGGEDGHVIGDAETNIGGNAIIGTTGTSYVDGNVFGGGRGFSGEAQTAGTVGGNVRVNINAGSVYGSVYGGGRLASVGTMFEFPTLTDGSTNPAYGQFKEDETGANAKTYGHVTINISGGTIGNENATGDGAKYSGNVFGGSMGRLNLLDGTTRNPIWPKMAQVKESNVNIYGSAVVRRSVYGGGELGTVRDNAYVTIGGQKTADANANGEVPVTPSGSPTVMRDVFGGGYGSEDKNYTIFTIPELKSATADPTNPANYESHTYAYTPMQFAGCVGKNTYVNVAGGYIRKSVYGGGEMASVGVINYRAAELSGTSTDDKVTIGPIGGKTYYYEHIDKHGDATNGFALSWPYKFEYVTGFEGATHVNITGGRLGIKDGETEDGFADNGDVYGAGKGLAGDYKDYLFCANVGSTDVKIAYGSTPEAYTGTGDLIAGAVYGGGEDGHVMGNTKLTISGGLIYHSVYGGGSGKGKFPRKLLKTGKTYGSNNDADYETRDAYSITAGKVFGNTEVNMTGGYVVRNIYGGGNMGSVGKGNYAGGTGDYNTAGYGEKVANLWSNNDFLKSGKCTVNISGGTIGYIDESDPKKSMYPLGADKKPIDASLPYGNVFGGCRGEAVPNITDSPRYYYCPEFFVGYANETEVTIEGTTTKILGSVYGGGMDGHVRRDAHVIIKGGEIGIPFDATNKTNVKTSAPDNIQWLARGNVYGAGSGIGKYNDEFCISAGSVNGFSKVDIQGGTIHRNVYGGGSLASIGAPKIPANRTDNPTQAQTLNEVKISGGHIGGDYSYSTAGTHVYGGHVFGGSRGDASLDATKFSTSMFTSITINATNSPVIEGSVFGGGEVGIVKGSVDVTMNGGTVNDDVYGGGALANTNTENAKDANGNLTSEPTYNTTVNLYGGLIKGDAYGGGLGQLHKDAVAAQPAQGTEGQEGYVPAVAAQDEVPAIAAMVYGNVHVTLGNDTEDETKASATAFMTSYLTDDDNKQVVKSGRVFGCNNLNGSPMGNVTVTVNRTVTGKKSDGSDLKRTTMTRNSQNEVTNIETPHTYEVAAVYGGGNLADYTATGKKARVEIMTCDVSIEEVYGGGNAAKVPETDVEVKGAHQIEHVFGGGNGEDKYTLDGGTSWITNPGADIDGNTKTIIRGGYIHEAYGGSNEKGTISGNTIINTGTDGCAGCPVQIDKLVGAGNNADVNGNLIMVLGCYPTTKTPLIFAGADNANVNGNVELTITSGTFGKVFGGNNQGGAIKGHILLNIEETGCNPINIEELYLGGNEAAYSRYGYYLAKDANNLQLYRDAEKTKPLLMPRESATDERKPVQDDDTEYANISDFEVYGQPILNVVSCTSIGKVFGGGYGVGGKMYADPTVNINMIPGEKAASISATADNPDKLGSIGYVYGGGNAADVIGNPTVNIGTESKVKLHLDYNPTDGYTMSGDRDVKGAYITGNVFGGGMGKDDTFTCEKAMVGIDGDGVANPVGGTTVNIYNGIVLGSVYGGGEVGRVEKNTAVTIGTGDGVDATTDTPTSTPEIRGSVFGGGKGLETHGYSALVRGNPTVVVQGNAKVRGNVYGGGQIASVARYNVAQTDDEGAPYGVKKDEPYALKNNTSGFCTVTIKGYAEIGPETIGSDVKTTTVGHVFGAGKGILPGGDYAFVPGTTKRMVAVRDGAGHITGSTWDTFTGGEADYITFVKTLALSSQTNVTIDGNAKVKGSVFGGSESGFVQFDANVNVTGGTIGTQGKGGADFGNVYGGGKGDVEYTGVNHDYITAGIVKGNTKVVISQAEGKTTKILHNVYGGGAYGTVGEFEYDATGMPTARKTYTVGTEVHNTTGGTAEIYITGGTIGTNGNENGMIFGSSRGDVGAPGSIHDKAAWVYDTHVVIGDTTENATITTATPLIKGSVYGGGENGHNLHHAYVRINGGTIGITNGEPIGSYTAGGASYPYRGNVYGGGCGTDKYEYDSDNNGSLDAEAFNPIAGIVQGNAFVNITGGIIVHNVYGAGAMGSVGKTVTTEGVSKTTGGVTTINISGDSRIGIDGTAGEGNVFGAARGDADATSNEFALVRKNTNVSVTGGTVKGNVYGGGELGCVGVYNISSDYRTFTWKNTDGTDNTADNSKNTGICNVTVDGASAVINGHVFGAGKGKDDTFWCEKGIAYSTNVSIQNGTVVKNIYGGGEVGRVETDTKVKIGDGEGTEGGASAPTITGSVFGGGAGVETHGYSALVRGNTTVTVEGNAKVGHSVYGGGEIASVGKYGLDSENMPSILQGGGYCYVTVLGHATITDDVFGAGEGVKSHFDNTNEDLSKRSRRMTLKSDWTSRVGADRFDWNYLTTLESYSKYLETLALVTHPEVAIDGSAAVGGSVFGGGDLGLTKGSVVVNIKGGTIMKDVYGGGKLANTNTTSTVDLDGDGVTETVHPTTKVNLLGGLIKGDAYGGGLGQKTGVNGATSDIEAIVYGDVNVNLNGLEASDYVASAHSSLVTGIDDPVDNNIDYYRVGDNAGCIISGKVFGCNNINGTPKGHAKVHVFKTANSAKDESTDITGRTTYDVDAVYGGGNQADYIPTNDNDFAEVIVDGCSLSSIESVYGGGNAAATPATNVKMKGCYIVNYVFGGGNGYGNLPDGTENPGADVGYHTKGTASYGTGKAVVELQGGTIRSVYGGSNSRGTIRGGTSVTQDNAASPCNLLVKEIYGGGKDADMEGGTLVKIGCIPGLEYVYGGAKDANVSGGVNLAITGGHFKQVFGGNNQSGTIQGPIRLYIEESCDSLVIDSLFIGGNQAPYSIYGYYQDGVDGAGKPIYKVRTKDDTEAAKPHVGATGVPYANPELYITSCTRIGYVFGGGLGSTAVMHGSPTIYIDQVPGAFADYLDIDGDGTKDNNPNALGFIGKVVTGKKVSKGAIFGGGNEADVIGNTNVLIGTRIGTKVELKSQETTAADGTVIKVEETAKGANIYGNVYGGGNNAEVTGNTNVVIGRDGTLPTTTTP